MPKLTPWYSPDVKPARIGMYEVEARFSKGSGWFASWNGKCWIDLDRGGPLCYQERRWRGLTKEAK